MAAGETKRLAGAVCLALLWLAQAAGVCDEAITSALKNNIVPDAFRFFTGTFMDIWISRDLAKLTNCSYSVMDGTGNVTNYVRFTDGRSFASPGRIWDGGDGVIRVKSNIFQKLGLVFPIYVSHEVLAYYSCYPNVPGNGSSIITVRTDSWYKSLTLHHLYEAKVTFRSLQELGIPINDGVDCYDISSS